MHTCPECDQACYCGGDIGDVDVGDRPNCTCCPLDEEDDDDAEFDQRNRLVKRLAPAEEDRRWNGEPITALG